MFKNLIQDHYDDLTPGFRRLADFLMINTLDAAFFTATELARRVSVDPATVVRFSQELGYSGYRELSREIKVYVKAQLTSASREAVEATDEGTLIQSIFDHITQHMQRFMIAEKQNMVEAVKLLSQAPRVWIIGEGASYDLSGYMAHLLETIAIPAKVFYPNMVDAGRVLPYMQAGDVLLAIALGNPGIDAGYTLRQAYAKGVQTICISGSGIMLPAREANVTITVPVRSPLGIPSFAAAGMVLSLLWEAVAAQDLDRTMDAFSEMQTHMSEFLELRNHTPEYELASPQKLWGTKL